MQFTMDPEPDRANALPVYVLIGGASRRFGADKATHHVDGEPWARHVGRRLAKPSDPVLLVGDRPAGDALADSVVIPDTPGVPGPLGGLLAALADREARWGAGLLCLASCDLVRPERAWLGPLLHSHQAREDLDVAAYHAADRWQPFPSVVHTRWIEKLVTMSGEGVRSLQIALQRSDSVATTWSAGLGPPQANSPEELARRLDQPGKG